MYITAENAFQDRKTEVSIENIRRIIKSYNLAKAVQQKKEDVYQISNDWIPIYQHHMGTIIEKLQSKDESAVANIYKNFFREHCSVGLHGLPVDMFSTYFSGNTSDELKDYYLRSNFSRFSLWLDTLGKALPISELKSPDVGNPYGVYIDGSFYRHGSEYLHYYATIINRLVGKKFTTHILEIGGGFGGLGYYLMRDNINATYIDCDLPENMALAAFYLMHAMPEKKIGLYGEIDLDLDLDLALSRKDYDAILIPNFEIENIKSSSIDLAFNSYSFAEMSADTIHNYVNHFNRISKKFIYHVNHNRIKQVKADEFNIDLSQFEILFRAPALWNFGVNKDMDEFEYLYKKINSEF
jgi:putative sugar O-methyltransferase